MTFMNGFKTIFNFNRENAPHSSPTPTGYNWQPVGNKTIPSYDSYDNVFPYSNAIAQRFSTIIPYAVDRTGTKLENPIPAAVQALYAPNNSFSCLEFLKFIATSLLTQSHLDILVWTRNGNNIIAGGDITPDNIAGYTFLPQNSRQYAPDRSDWYHRVTMSVNGVSGTYTFTRNETIALTYSVHPLDPTRGISPAMTIRKWANVDDMIADYERGFFGNGAVPAGMMGIVSTDSADFQRNKNRLEDTFRGAGNNNGIVYNMIPVDPLTNRPSDTGKLVWVPFQQANNTLDLTTVNDVVNNRLASALAVPDIVRGIDTGQTYANAQQAERAFVENTLMPLCMTVWDKWQFELDRITGGLGYGITFDLDLPAQADVEQVQAETQATKINSLIQLVNAGASVKSAVKALGLPAEYEALTLIGNMPTFNSEDTQPNMPQLTSQRESFDRNLDKQDTKTVTNAFKDAQSFFNKLIELRLAQHYENSISDDYEQICQELEFNLLNQYAPTILKYAQENGVTLLQAIQTLAQTDQNLANILAAYTDQQLQGLYTWTTLPLKYEEAYKEHLHKMVEATGNNAMKTITKMLAKADTEQWDKKTLVSKLTQLLGYDRAELLASNEFAIALNLGSLFSAKNMSEDLGVKLRKVWHTSGLDYKHGNPPCDFCVHMDGKTIGLEQSFMGQGELITIDGTDYVNDTIESMETPHAHPHCRCVLTYEVVM